MEEQNQQKSSKIATIVLALALLGSLGLNYFQYNKSLNTASSFETKVDTLELARTEIETELNATYAELEKFKGQNAQMDSILNEANGKMDEQKIRINGLMKTVKNKDELNAKLNSELADLRKLKDEYLDKIDSLMIANQKLTNEKNDLTSKVQGLDKDLKTTVSAASLLKAEYIKATAFKKRNATKYSETAMAKRTNKIEVSFKVLQNAIAKAGDRTVYLRLVEPGGEIVGNKASGSKVININGEDVLFTNSTVIQYVNTDQDVMLYWEEEERNFKPGSYNIEIYIDNYLAGSSSVNLK